MKIPSAYDPSSQKGDSAMTPMIDVVFLLLIFFVCASAVPVAEVMVSSPLQVTSTESSPVLEEKDDKLIRLQIRKNEQKELSWILSGDQQGSPLSSLEELRNQLKNSTTDHSNRELVLDIGEEITMGTALETYDLCDQLPFRKISFGVRKQSP